MVERQLEYRVMPQAVGVIAVLVASRNHQHAKAQNVRDAVPDPFGSARVLNAGRKPLRDAKPALDLAQRQQARKVSTTLIHLVLVFRLEDRRCAGWIDPCGGWLGGRLWWLVDEALWVVAASPVEGVLARGVDGIDLTVMDLVRGHEADAGVMVVLVVPVEE